MVQFSTLVMYGLKKRWNPWKWDPNLFEWQNDFWTNWNNQSNHLVFTKTRNCTYHMHFLPFVLYVDFVQFQGYKIVSSNALLILHWYLNINKYSRNSGFTHRMSEAVVSKLSRPNWLAKVIKDMVFSFRSSQLNMILNVVNCLIYT